MKKDKQPASENAALVAFLSQYTPSGETADKDFYTTTDIVRQLEDVTDISTIEVYSFLVQRGYKMERIDGKIYFALYKH